MGRTTDTCTTWCAVPRRCRPDAVATLYGDALNAYLLGERDSDTLDRLILAHGLTWKEVRLFRAFNHYLIQLGLGSHRRSVKYVDGVPADREALRPVLPH